MEEFAFLLNRRLARSSRSRAVYRQSLLKISEDANVVNDQGILLIFPNPIRPCDGLHERVVLHRLVEIHRRAGRHIEACDPHRTDKHDSQWVVRFLELGLKVFLNHAFSVLGDVQSPFLELFDLVLGGRDHNRHIGRLEEAEPFFQFRSVGRVRLGEFLLQLRQCRLPILLNLVVHPHRRGFVDGYDHRFRQHASSHVMSHEVFRDLVDAFFSRD